MSEWNSEQYLRFKQQRTQAAADLTNRIAGNRPKHVLDIGCGPGNSTKVLKEAFPQADILGVDNAEDMIKRAKATYSDIRFRLCDVLLELESLGSFDVIFSNACLQWIPNHREFIPRVFDRLNAGGVLAVQMPMNAQEPLFQIMDSVVKETKWGFTHTEIETNGTLPPEDYFDILSGCTENFDIWETVYYHNMPNIQAMVEWIKGTRLRPYLNMLDGETALELEQEIASKAAAVYKKQSNGEIIFQFRRFFFTAVKEINN